MSIVKYYRTMCVCVCVCVCVRVCSLEDFLVRFNEWPPTRIDIESLCVYKQI